MYTVFINDKPLLIIKPDHCKELTDEQLEIKYDSDNSIKKAVGLLENNSNVSLVYLTSFTPEKTFELFKSQYTLIEAAGGIVQNSRSQLLFIFRNGKWDLPKGKMESGETPKESALREVEEECGIANLKIVKPITTTFHTYNLKGKQILKSTYWFEMIGESDKLVPQNEEGITEVKWLNKQQVNEALKNTYLSIREVVSKLYER